MCNLCKGKKKIVCPACENVKFSSCARCRGNGVIVCPKCTERKLCLKK